MKGNLMVRLMTLIILLAIVLAHFSGQTDLVSFNWLWLAVMPALMGLQATFTGWCPAEMLGKLSKTGECCPSGTCDTEPKTEAKQQTGCCGSGSQVDAPCCDNKKTASTSNCCSDASFEIKVLGTGCATCANTVKLIESTAEEIGVEVNVIKVEDIAEIASYGVMSTPGIVIKEQVVHSGGMPNKKMIIEWLS